MKALRLALVALACTAPLLAAAQWQWIDKDGRRVFSDQPPPLDVPASKIVRQPGVRPAPAAAANEAPATTAAAAPTAAVPKLTGKDKELEAKKKQVEAAEADKKKAEEAKFAAAQAENCTRARSAKAVFDTGARVARVNAQGEREFYTDDQRAAEVKRLEGVIARDCVKAQ